MTTFTTEDREKATQDVSITVEPIPFVGYVFIEDTYEKEKMLREQIRMAQAECQRLKAKLMENGIHD